MNKPTSNPLTPQDQAKVNAKLNKACNLFNLPSDIMTSLAILSVAADEMRAFGDTPAWENGAGHPYNQHNGKEDEIAQEAAKPLRPEARNLLDKWGL